MIRTTARASIEAYERYIRGRRAFIYWRELEDSQWWDRGKLVELQLQRLRRLLAHADSHCPYFSSLWRTLGLNVKSVDCLADLTKWPLLTKETIRQHATDVEAAGYSVRSFAQSTGGSSGTPLSFRICKDSYDRRVAATYRGYNWAGAGPGTKQFYLWGVPLGERTVLQRTKEWAYNTLHRRAIFNTFTLNRSTAAAAAKQIGRFRPDVIVAYTSAADLIARSCREQSIELYRPHSIVVGAEKLHAFQRESIESAFRAPVFETYGSREFMLIATECAAHAGLHVSMENLIVEIVGDDGLPVRFGEEGQVAVTDLTNYAQPFIRYLNGDRAVATERFCPCGRSSFLLESVTGRVADFIYTSDGRSLSGLFFPHLLKDFASIERFQVVQKDLDAVSLQCVLRHELTADDKLTIQRRVHEYLGPITRLSIEPVADIPLTPQGKRRVVVSLVNPPPSTTLSDM